VRRFLVCVNSDVSFIFQSTGFIAAYPMVVIRSMLEHFKCCWKIVFDTVSVSGSTCLVVCFFHQRRFWHILSEARGAVCCPLWISLRAVAHELIPKGGFSFWKTRPCYNNCRYMQSLKFSLLFSWGFISSEMWNCGPRRFGRM